MEKYRNINSTLLWICGLSIVAYFIFLPINNTRPTPAKISPIEENRLLKLEANPLLLFRDEKEVEELITTTSTTTTEEFPKALTPIINE